jgi:hypothetical protein
MTGNDRPGSVGASTGSSDPAVASKLRRLQVEASLGEERVECASGTLVAC